MKRLNKYSIFIAVLMLFLSACKDFFNPEQELFITSDKLFDDWYEYRAVEMGLYAIQSDLVEQLLILGELRGDLLQVTPYADPDLIEIYNFNISKENKYASPTNFFKLISACNNLKRVLEKNHPEVLDPESVVTNYDRLYGEVLCMRAWAYFNAVRIYGKVPFIPESLTTIDETNEFLNTPGTYLDSVDITYAGNGYDTISISYDTVISLEKKYYDQNLIIDYFTNELENKVKAVGVNHSLNNNDNTWQVTVWNDYAMNTLLGQMYLTDDDKAKAAYYFEKVIYNSTTNYRYQVTNTYGFDNWRRIFGTSPVFQEHILVADFNKLSQIQNDFQKIFDIRKPNKYMLKPTRQAILLWETTWDNFTYKARYPLIPISPPNTAIGNRGIPGDFYRGYGVSYAYVRNGEVIDSTEIKEMLINKADGDYRSSRLKVQNADTVVWKYSWNKTEFDNDADFIYYRAAAVHLWLAEVYTYLAKMQSNGLVLVSTPTAVGLLNDAGTVYPPGGQQVGIRGRVGFGGTLDGKRIGNIIYIQDPFTNEVLGFKDLTTNFYAKQLLLEQYIVDEQARELAFEGDRFYTLMRAAERRGDPSFLASAVSNKFPSGKREEIYNLLMDKNNWYIHYFE